MATIIEKKDKAGKIISYKVMVCVGRDEQYKQIWRTRTFKRPEGLTPAKERKEIERQADAWAENQKAEYERTHAKTDKSKITLADFIHDHWMKDHILDGEHKPTGITFFEYMSRDIISYFGEKKKLSQIDTESVKRYLKFLNKEARTQKGDPYSAETRVHHYNALRNILGYAKRMHYIKDNPCDDLTAKEKPHKEKKQVDFLSPDETRRFIACLENEPLFWKAFMNVLITTGLRRGEALALTWADIDPDELTITVRRNITVDKNAVDKYQVGSTKTGKSRTVPLSARVYGLLMQLRREREEQLQVKMMPAAFIFCRDTDPHRPLYPTTPTRWLRRFIEKNNLPNVSPHDLRHSAASLAIEGGASMKEVQELRGHANPATTMGFYVGLTEQTRRRTMEGIEELLKHG